MGLSSDEGLHVEADDKSQLPQSSSGHSPHSLSTSVHVLAQKIRGARMTEGQMESDKRQEKQQGTDKDTIPQCTVAMCIYVWLSSHRS